MFSSSFFGEEAWPFGILINNRNVNKNESRKQTLFYSLLSVHAFVSSWFPSTFRWGKTPLDEARNSGSRLLMRMMEDAKAEEESKFPGRRGQEVQGTVHCKFVQFLYSRVELINFLEYFTCVK